MKAFDECRNAAQAGGLVNACSHMQGAGEAVFFCPKDKKVVTKVVGGGCAGCTTGAGSAPAGLGALALGLGIAAMRRRTRRIQAPKASARRGDGLVLTPFADQSPIT